MATTAIWAVKGWLGKVVIYAENPDKTKNPEYFEKQEMTDRDTQGLIDVIEYAMRDDKTEKQYFVSGINCAPSTARDEMMAVKKRYGKEEGIMAFHGYQSFAPGEVTPDMAHSIGLKMAQQLWGERFQIVVSTHLDKTHHIHNHFVINSVSYVDGKRYNDCTATYMKMRSVSDQLCSEYRLSVIENPQRGKSKDYGEWRAEQEGRPTWRGLIKVDVDSAIVQSMTQQQLFDNLRKQGYEIKIGKDISVRPPGKERFVRLLRNFGEEYSLEGIRKRILAQNQAQRPLTEEKRKPSPYLLHGNLNAGKRLTGLRALYLHYCFKMGILPKSKQPSKKMHFLLREDLRKLNKIMQESKLLGVHRIDTTGQLFLYKSALEEQIKTLTERRKQLRCKIRGVTNETNLNEAKVEISAMSKKLGVLRKEVSLCEDIVIRSAVIKDKLSAVRVSEKAERKEKDKHEHISRCSRPNR